MSGLVLDVFAEHVEGLSPTSGGNYSGFCPIHGEIPGKSSKSLSVNAETGMWQCFAGCGAGGVASFMRALGVAPTKIDRIIERIKPHLKKTSHKNKVHEKTGLFRAEFELPERILGLYDWCPDSLVQDGFDEKLLWDHDVGYDRDHGRITYPIRDVNGFLAGIVGRNTRPTALAKYKVYKQELLRFDGVPRNYNFNNRDFLWRWDKFYEKARTQKTPTVYVCEGFKACLWLVQNGYDTACALMGSSMSPSQALFLQRLGANVVLCLDNNRAGRNGTDKIGYTLVGSIIRVMNYPDDENVQQPDDLDPEELHEAVTGSLTLTKWRRKYDYSSYGSSQQRSWRKEAQA